MVAALGLAPAVPLRSQAQLWTADGTSEGAACGTAVRALGDIDRDGTADFGVGVPRDDAHGSDVGAVLICSGQDGRLIRLLRGESAGDAFGYALGDAGDANGDGWPDVIVGAPYEERREAAHLFEDAGCARVISGRDGQVLWALRGSASGDALGWSVAGAGDLDRDGCSDVVAGAPFWDRRAASDVGMVRVYSGRTGKVLYELLGDAEGDRFGWAVCSVGDGDRDGSREILVGIEGSTEKLKQAGRARLYSGRRGRLMHTLRTGQTEDYFGTAVASAGDLDGDGRDDLLVGGWNGRDDAGVATGIACVFAGRSGKLLLTLWGKEQHDRFGATVAGIGDVDGDRCGDLVIGAPQEDDQAAGYVVIVSGRSGAVLCTLSGESVGSRFGTAVAGLPDCNGDGVPDVLVGAPGLRESGGWSVLAGPPRAPR